jgi:hypothetical protein
MSPRSGWAAAFIAVLAVGGPVGAASAASNQNGGPDDPTDLVPAAQQSNDPAEPGAGDADGSTPQDGTPATPTSEDPAEPGAGDADGSTPQDGTPATPTSWDPAANAQCGQVIFTNTLPTVVTCGPVTITFNTVTSTTTVTTVSAPITAANGPITTTNTSANTNQSSTATKQCRPARTRKAKSTRPKRTTPTVRRKRSTFVVNASKGRRTVRFRLLIARRPGF